MSSIQNIRWSCKHFSELTATEIYDILQLRSEVFVVEQNCVYQDMDNKDQSSYHLCGYAENQLAGYCRLLLPGVSYTDAASIGRVVTAPFARRQKLGIELMKRAFKEIDGLMGKQEIVIAGQVYIQKFYERLGFVPEGKIFLEDGIPHIQMRRKP